MRTHPPLVCTKVPKNFCNFRQKLGPTPIHSSTFVLAPDNLTKKHKKFAIFVILAINWDPPLNGTKLCFWTFMDPPTPTCSRIFVLPPPPPLAQ